MRGMPAKPILPLKRIAKRCGSIRWRVLADYSEELDKGVSATVERGGFTGEKGA